MPKPEVAARPDAAVEELDELELAHPGAHRESPSPAPGPELR